MHPAREGVNKPSTTPDNSDGEHYFTITHPFRPLASATLCLWRRARLLFIFRWTSDTQKGTHSLYSQAERTHRNETKRSSV